MKKRSIGLMILLTIVTLGIYQLYWTCSFQNQLKKNTGDGFGGLGHILFSLLVPIAGQIYFAFVWQYKAGKRLAKLGAKDRSTMYLLFALATFIALPLSLLNPFIMQTQANNLK